MKFLSILLLAISLLGISAKQVDALIVIPALVLIPLAKIIAVVIASLSFPIAGIGVLVHSNTRNKKTAVLISLILLTCVLAISFLVLRAKYPQNPIF